eukprot:TRINITY_DN777_c0_g1_i4.p1 TRINITY_DN777_c0_g1~~TRINITY_DN777_c0_g1_i4.p1  ORF type:complete len:147 (+),score=25.15 TRINITY_DN777_c0_g1_i4:371-811(+)
MQTSDPDLVRQKESKKRKVNPQACIHELLGPRKKMKSTQEERKRDRKELLRVFKVVHKMTLTDDLLEVLEEGFNRFWENTLCSMKSCAKEDSRTVITVKDMKTFVEGRGLGCLDELAQTYLPQEILDELHPNPFLTDEAVPKDLYK